ncbi:hypothetical protein [Actinomadura atramentaria]|uniref:hypothetical protein n=1 Tax=Actinomadura atramentaria TaxID=1990 RepID=UPI000378A0D6|nr:hypothetical protein [Actinomadura atramentaria]
MGMRGTAGRGGVLAKRVAAGAVGAAAVASLATGVARVTAGDGEAPGGRAPRAGDLVSVAQEARAPVVAPLGRRLAPSVLAAGTGPLPAAAVERVRRLTGVAGVTVVDAAQAQVAGRRVGLLGVDPSAFRAYAPAATAASDQLWQTVATGGLAVSFDLGRDGSLALGAIVPAGDPRRPGQVRVGAYASMGIGDVDAVVSRAQARALGMPDGNALIVSAPEADPAALGRKLRELLPAGTKVAALAKSEQRKQRAPKSTGPAVTGRPDGAQGDRTTVSGNRMTPTMRAVVLEINRYFGPFPVIGCFRSTGDPQDHGDGRACDFMETTTGRMPSAAAQRHGDAVAQYAITNARRLGISYVIWKQHIWNVRGGGWRPMENRGSITQNHYDHVHISVLR